ncbi:hypothetical protein [Actinotalea sp.]|uniref:hypothetical protein n=1 Tax=Actinotalea sp. TaxID=1872145 RepID=UPI0035647674
MSDDVTVALIAATPPTIVAIAGMVQNRRTRRQVDAIGHQTRPNHGSSMYDRVTALETATTYLGTAVQDLVRRMDRHLDK